MTPRRNLPGIRGEHDGEAALGSARHAVGGRPVAVGLRGPGGGGLRVEANGINVIVDAERRAGPASCSGRGSPPTSRCWACRYGAFALGFGISFWQAAIAGLVGIVFSFLLCGFVALAGKRGSAPTMVLSRAAFGVRGNRLPAVISWLLTVGWETVLTVTGDAGHRHRLRPPRLGLAAPGCRWWRWWSSPR